MARQTMKTLRQRNAELVEENERLRIERQRFVDACTAGVMTAAGVERWIEDLADALARVAERGSDERQALNEWIAATVALSGHVQK